MRITKLEYQKRDPNRVSIYVDDKFLVGIEADKIISLGLYKNQEIGQEFINKIIGESEFGKLFNAMLNFLSFRPRSEWEIRRKLKFKTKDLELIELVVDKLKNIGQINDQEFAKWFIDQRRAFKIKSARAIEYELARLGVKTKVSSQDDDNLALQVLKKKFKETSDPVKMQRFLLTRGFDWEVVKKALKEYNHKRI